MTASGSLCITGDVTRLLTAPTAFGGCTSRRRVTPRFDVQPRRDGGELSMATGRVDLGNGYESSPHVCRYCGRTYTNLYAHIKQCVYEQQKTINK